MENDIYINSIVYFNYNNKNYYIKIDKTFLTYENYSKLNLYIYNLYTDGNSNFYIINNSQKFIIPKNINHNETEKFFNYFNINPIVINKQQYQLINNIIYSS